MSRNYLLKTGPMSEIYVTATGFEPTTAYFVNEHSTSWPDWPVWLNSWVFIYKLSSCGFVSLCSHLVQPIVIFFFRYLSLSLLHEKNIKKILNSCFISLIDVSDKRNVLPNTYCFLCTLFLACIIIIKNYFLCGGSMKV